MALPMDPLGDRDGPYPKRPPREIPPKPETDPAPRHSDAALTIPETGRAIPILHGTAKMQGTVIEQYSGVLYSGFLKAPYWLPNNQYSIGDRVTANGNTYVATKDGISAGSGTGPSGTGTNIVDGNTAYGGLPVDMSVRWDFQSVGTTLFWIPNTAYTVNRLTTVVLANGNFYLCVQSGTSAATGIGPTGTGTNIVDNTCQWNYIQPGWHIEMAVAYCEGQIFGGLGGFSDAALLRDYHAISNDYLQLFNGTPTGIGVRNALFPTPDTVQRDDYSNVALLLINASTGADNKIANIATELSSGVGVDATHLDENAADIAIEFLTHGRKGAGWATARVDTTGTLGAGAASYRTYCTAFGLLLGWVIDTQTTAMELLGMLLAATNSDPVWSNGGSLGGMLKIVPRGDQALTANGVTYTPVTTPVFNLTQDDIIGQVAVTHRGSSTAFNSIPIEYTDRAMGYVRNTVDDPDMADVDKRGLQRGGTVALPQVITPASAVMLSRIYAQRSLKVRNTYSFRLSHRFMLLEPSDVVTLADSVMGMTARPVKITAMEEEQVDGTFLFEAEDYPVAVHAAALYTPQTGDGFGPNRRSTVGQVAVLPSATMGPQVLTDSTSTRGTAVHNIWPNANSESSPPDGTNLTTPEWAGRVNAGAGAYAGNWVRAISATKSVAGVALGDQVLGTDPDHLASADTSTLSCKVKCSPGDVFNFEAQGRLSATGVGGAEVVAIKCVFYDSTDTLVAPGGSSPSSVFAGGGGSYVYASLAAYTPATAVTAYFRLYLSVAGNSSGTSTAQFDAIGLFKKSEASSDAASAAPALTLVAGGNTFTDIPGTSQVFTPNTASRRIKVSLVFSGFAPVAGNVQNVRIVFGATPTQAGSTYNLFWNTANQHQSWGFIWTLAAGAFGAVGATVTVKAQVRSPTGSTASLTMDSNDSVSMVIEEIG